MTIRECYEAVGSAYDKVLGRLGSEEFIKKFAIKFLEDKTFKELGTYMQEGKEEEAIRMAHSLKGICLNLGFTALGDASSELTDALKNTMNTFACAKQFEKVAMEYDKLINVLNKLEK